MKKVFLVVGILFFFFTSSVYAQTSIQNIQEEKAEATIRRVLEEKQIVINGEKQLYQKLEVTVLTGSLTNSTIIIENGTVPQIGIQKYSIGEKVVITIDKTPQGNKVYITDFVRRDSLYLLGFIFILVTIFIGKKRGITSLISMFISFLVIFNFILPFILAGLNPIFIVLIASFFLIPVTFFLSHGFNKKTIYAVIGTYISLVVTAILSFIFVNTTHLTGFASEESQFLEATKQGIVNIKALLLAGILVSAVGILDDITISQSAIVFQLKSASAHLSFSELYSRAMEVGKDHIGSLVNTLILVYAGAFFPLLLLFINNPLPYTEVINYEIIAGEIVKTLVLSIGLILAVPVTTFIASLSFFIHKE